eukprot:scaffold156130_cov31-Tisochrysis_lutea.AAC.1
MVGSHSGPGGCDWCDASPLRHHFLLHVGADGKVLDDKSAGRGRRWRFDEAGHRWIDRRSEDEQHDGRVHSAGTVMACTPHNSTEKQGNKRN